MNGSHRSGDVRHNSRSVRGKAACGSPRSFASASGAAKPHPRQGRGEILRGKGPTGWLPGATPNEEMMRSFAAQQVIIHTRRR